ncbi:hypothetical protein CYMTET_26314 [Cymbomonas tetramitiformis]|uniref:EF-hand domain-containing protein n=1 Tax=Cymbomonas tetramitiformis TaxID=36881 RepID=A0AAE0KY08_9CHLO|nr:hypothetical protein CYMTET_26314 [Cymbomonas tetramitiformis]
MAQLPSFSQLDLSGDGCITPMEYEASAGLLLRVARGGHAARDALEGGGTGAMGLGGSRAPAKWGRALHQLPPPPPPSVGHLPPAYVASPLLLPMPPSFVSPPPQSSSLGLIVIEDNTTAGEELGASIDDPDVHTVVLRADATLEQPLPSITKVLTIAGECHLGSAERPYCAIDAGGRHRVLHAFGELAALTLNCVHLTRGNLTGKLEQGGAGLLVAEYAQAVLTDCLISDCCMGNPFGTAAAAFGGAGLLASAGAVLRMEGCVVTGNVLDGGKAGAGIGLLQSSAVLVNCSIAENLILNALGGGGLAVLDTTSLIPHMRGTNVTLEGCAIYNNLGNHTIGGIGMGIVPVGSIEHSINVNMIDTLVHGNALGDSQLNLGYGAGFLSMGEPGAYSESVIRGSLLEDNRCKGFCEGAALFPWVFTTLLLAQSVISNNGGSTVLYGGGVSIVGDCSLVMEDCLLADNVAQYGAAIANRWSYAEGNTDVVNMTGSVFKNNSADFNGGAIWASRLALEAVDCRFEGNTAGEGGAGLHLEFAVGFLLRCLFYENRCIQNGGALVVRDEPAVVLLSESVLGPENLAGDNGGGLAVSGGARVQVIGVLVSENLAAFRGGGLYVEAFLDFQASVVEGCLAGDNGGGANFDLSSQATLVGVTIRGCTSDTTGGGLMASMGSIIALQDALIHGNTAQYGGALAVMNSNLTITLSNLTGNTGTYGGGLVALDLAVIIVAQCEMQGNSATHDGGCMYVGECALAVRVEGTTCVDPAAERGAGVFMERPHNATHLELQGVRFGACSATTVGCHVFWMYHTTERLECQGKDKKEMCSVELAPPECIGCDWPNGTSLYVTTAMTFSAEQDGTEVPSPLHVRGAKRIDPPLYYIARDFYGNIADLVTTSIVAITLAHVSGSEEGVDTTGDVIVPHLSSHGARYTSLGIAAAPGALLNMTFMPEVSAWAPVSIDLELMLCEYGEVYDPEDWTCEPCKEGYIKFDNGTAECVECDAAVLKCHGGNSFTLEDGYWMALSSMAAECGRADVENTALCVFDRTYSCDVESACTSTSGARSNLYEGGAAYTAEAAAALCGEGYNAADPVCGTCMAGYEQLYGGKCQRCTSTGYAVEHVVRTIVVVGTLVAGGWLLLRLRRRQNKREKRRRMTRINVRMSKVSDIQVLVSTLANHAQVSTDRSSPEPATR